MYSRYTALPIPFHGQKEAKASYWNASNFPLLRNCDHLRILATLLAPFHCKEAKASYWNFPLLGILATLPPAHFPLLVILTTMLAPFHVGEAKAASGVHGMATNSQFWMNVIDHFVILGLLCPAHFMQGSESSLRAHGMGNKSLNSGGL